MLELRFTAKFKKDYKRIKKQGKDIAKLESTLETLVYGESLPEAMRDHSLGGTYRGTGSAISSRTGCSSTVSTRKDSFSSPRARGAIASYLGYKESGGVAAWIRFLES